MVKRSQNKSLKDQLSDIVADVSEAVTPVTTAEKGSYNRDPTKGEFYGFGRRDFVFSLDASGHVISRRLEWPEEPAHVANERLQFTLPVTVPALPRQPRLPLGLTIISGNTAVGKSTFLRALAMRMDLNRIICVEPHDTGEEIGEVNTFFSADAALAAAVKAAYTQPTQLTGIDSLRAPLFETTGAAGERGIIMPFFTQLTRVSNSLAQAGISVIATITR